MRKKNTAFQLRGLRQICKITTTFIERANEFVFKAASERAGMRVKPITEYIDESSERLWMHILRADPADAMRHVTLDREGRIDYPQVRRVGRPRKDWKTETTQRNWDKIAAKEGNRQSRYNDHCADHRDTNQTHSSRKN